MVRVENWLGERIVSLLPTLYALVIILCDSILDGHYHQFHSIFSAASLACALNSWFCYVLIILLSHICMRICSNIVNDMRGHFVWIDKISNILINFSRSRMVYTKSHKKQNRLEILEWHARQSVILIPRNPFINPSYKGIVNMSRQNVGRRKTYPANLSFQIRLYWRDVIILFSNILSFY